MQLLAGPEVEDAEAALQAGPIGLFPAVGQAPGSYPGAVLLLMLDSRRPPFDRVPARSAVAAALRDPDLVKRVVAGVEPSRSLIPSMPEAIRRS